MRILFGSIFPLLSVFLLLWIEQSLESTYFWKTIAKVSLFFIIPFLFFRVTRFPFLRLRQSEKKDVKLSIGLGFGIMVCIIGTFILLKQHIDIGALVIDLNEAGVTKVTFPFVALYILFGNSFLEEFFFRGILPDLFGETKLRWILPPFFFAIYHIAIFLPWFSPAILLLAVGGLWLGGLIFQLVNERSRTILNSWIIHMFADIGILFIGIYILYF